MDYAVKFQDVIGSYATASKSKLKTIKNFNDPTEVFQRLKPGYFKLDRAAMSDE